MVNSPTVSVIMGIFNCEKTLPDAIESLMSQTYQDFELIMCDDNSTDNTLNIAESYATKCPDKIIVLKNDKNKGLNFTLNKCLQRARGKYIARMDGDDMSLPKRFEKEVSFLESHQDIAIVGAAMDVFDEKGVWGKRVYSREPQKKDFLKGTPFAHPVCMVRKEAYKAVNGYSVQKKLLRVEDYHLWLKMYSKGFKGVNLNEVLYLYRDDRSGYKRRKFKYRINEAYVMRLAVRMLKLPSYNYLFALRPILVGLLPYCFYDKLHRWKMHNNVREK